MDGVNGLAAVDILETLPDGFIVLDRQWRITYMNPAAAARSPVPREQFVGRNLWEQIPDAVGTRFYREYQRALAEGVSVEFEEFYAPSGRWFRVRAHPTADGLCVYSQDVTAYRRTVQSLRDREEHIRLLMDSTAEAIFGIDGNGTCTFVNAACVRMLGYEGPEELIGRDMHALIHHTRRDGQPYPKADCPICRASAEQSGAHVLGEVLWRKDGSSFPAEYWSHPVVRDGEAVGQVVTFIDVTERERSAAELRRLYAQARAAEEALRDANERLEQRVRERTTELQQVNQELQGINDKLQISNRELQDFASVASHDLQEPLRKIQAFGDRLNQRSAAALGPDGQDYLKRMLAAAGRMQSLINDLLAFSRVTTKAQPFEPVDLNGIVADVLTDLEARVQQSGATVSVGPLPTVDADPLQMRQLFQNLLGNALKFTALDAAPAVQVGVSEPDGSVAEADGTVELFVRDNGIGFDEKYLDRIFNVFQRLHGRGVYEGTGIGLAVCRKIVERHGGSITARGRPGEGATFLFRLPVRHQTPSPASVAAMGE